VDLVGKSACCSSLNAEDELSRPNRDWRVEGKGYAKQSYDGSW
jgi:hypothetical protein